MKVLALDTCFNAVSAAVMWRSGCSGLPMRDVYEECATGHAERLMPMIDEIMEAAARDGGPMFSELDRIAVTVGPGTFTGVRTGIAAARALALATGVPVCGTSSLAVMAKRAQGLLGAALDGTTRLAVAVDARRGDFYLQCFSAGTQLELSSPALVAATDAPGVLAGVARGPWIAVGSGAASLAAAADEQRVDGLTVRAGLPALEPRASILAAMAPALPHLDPPRPLYLRAPDAKPQMSKILPRA